MLLRVETYISILQPQPYATTVADVCSQRPREILTSLRDGVVDEDEDGLFWVEFDPLANDINELAWIKGGTVATKHK